METKFKSGDRVRVTKNYQTSGCVGSEWATGKEGTIVKPGKTDAIVSIDGATQGHDAGGAKRGTGWYIGYEFLELLTHTPSKTLPPRFILQYELDADPFELFATEKEVRARIKELAEKSDLKRDSIKVYEIKNVRAVKLGTSIKFTK